MVRIRHYRTSEKLPTLSKANAQSHQEQKAMQQLRKAQKPHSFLIVEAKRVWALARQQNIPKDERQKYIQQLMSVVRGKVKEVVMKHDASRIIQTVRTFRLVLSNSYLP